MLLVMWFYQGHNVMSREFIWSQNYSLLTLVSCGTWKLVCTRKQKNRGSDTTVIWGCLSAQGLKIELVKFVKWTRVRLSHCKCNCYWRTGEEIYDCILQTWGFSSAFPKWIALIPFSTDLVRNSDFELWKRCKRILKIELTGSFKAILFFCHLCFRHSSLKRGIHKET